MFDPPGDEELPDAQRPSNGMECYRMLLWAMPACVAVTTLIGGAAFFAWFSVPLASWLIPLWLGGNVVSTIALGVFRARLKVGDGEGMARKVDALEVVSFVVLQIVIVPFVSYLVFMILVMAGL